MFSKEAVMGNYRGANPKSFLGYKCQISRGVYYLLSCTHNVRIEHEDDVSVVDDDGFLIVAEQCKKVSSKIKYTSKEFLNTLVNWLDLYKKTPDVITLQTEFILFLENCNEVDQSLQSFLYTNSAQPDIEALIQKILKYKSKSNDTVAILNQLSHDSNKLKTILKQFKISIPKSRINSETDIIQCAQQRYDFLENNVSDFVDKLLGWFNQMIERNKDIMEIKNSEFNKFIAQYFGFKTSLKLPNKNEVYLDENNETEQMYIKQLKLVTNQKTILQAAMIDFLRYNNMIDKSLLNGTVTQADINSMYEAMVVSWNENKEEIFRNNDKEENQGYSLYKTCIKDDIHLNGVSFYDEKATTRGAYNYIADKKGGIKIGWHPKFREKLGLTDE